VKYKWTIIGILLALIIGRGRPVFLVMGAALGIAMDIGFFRKKTYAQDEASADPVKKNPYHVLEVDSQASDDDIEAAYRRQMAQYHPDKVDGAAKEIRELAQKRASEINAAYDQIQKIRGKK
jgi:preprotein translocase subunit Sec63